jgi:circadian clock protein KaiC
MNEPSAAASKRATAGIAGLDHVLGGGFPVHRMDLIAGEPGTGKTTLALQFLLAGDFQGVLSGNLVVSGEGSALLAELESHAAG